MDECMGSGVNETLTTVLTTVLPFILNEQFPKAARKQLAITVLCKLLLVGCPHIHFWFTTLSTPAQFNEVQY